INAGKTVVTINPASNLTSEQVVYVAIGATVEDDADNAIAASSATFTVINTIRQLEIDNSPVIYSGTHLDDTLYYCVDSLDISWYMLSSSTEIVGFYYKLDQSSSTVPNASSGTYITTKNVKFSDLADGVYYFHIVMKDSQGTVGTEAVHFRINIKKTIDATADNITYGSGGTKVEIPAGAIDEDTKLNITDPEDIYFMPYDEGINKLSILKEFSFSKDMGKFNKNIKIQIPYTTSGIGNANEENLRIFWWNETALIWQLVAGSKVNTNDKYVEFETEHFSIFQIMEYVQTSKKVDYLSNYPNPFYAKRETTKIRYTLKEDSDVILRIYDLVGGLVLEKEFSSGNTYSVAGPNEYVWDGRNGNGDIVMIGSYICRIIVDKKYSTTKVGVK
ncbi:MAG: hypothetical protein GY861_01520, partial [bacterium]|nr:hypothetical protein [bacterium]